MNTTYKQLFILVGLLLLSVRMYAQPCPYTFSANGDPIIPGTVLAENQITSTGKVHAPSTVQFSAGNEIVLEPAFEVYEGGIFEADIEGCVSTCPDVNPCIDDTCTKAYPPSLFDSKGNEYYQHDLIITFPPDVTINYLNVGGPIYSCMPPMGPNTLEINSPGITSFCFNIDLVLQGILGPGIGIGTIDTCLCGENIIKYTNHNMTMQESTPLQASCGAGAEEGGGRFSLNYVYEPDFQLFNAFTLPYFGNQNLNDFAITQTSPPPTHTPLIAILDTGLEPHFLDQIPGDPFDGKYLYNQATAICSDVDGIYGWNFVDDNNYIKDNRGHGTLVAANMIESFYKMNAATLPPEIYPRILPVKIIDECGRGNTFDSACGIKYAELQGADIMNLSWGLPFNDQILQQILQEATNAGSYISCSAGNQSLDLTIEEHFPSGYANPYMNIDEFGDSTLVAGNPKIYEVAGLCKSLIDPCQPNVVNRPLWDLSNYYSQSFAEPALGSQYIINRNLPAGGEIYCNLNGTSFSAAIFSAALTRQMTLGPIDKDIMKNNSHKIHVDNEYYSYYLKSFCNY